MFRKEVAHLPSQRAGTFAVNDAHPRKRRAVRAVKVLIDLRDRLVDGLAAHFDLERRLFDRADVVDRRLRDSL